MLKHLVSIIFFILFSFECAADFKLKQYSPKNIPDDVAIFDIEGKEHYLEEYEGKTILLVFWATWCSPCVNEMVDLEILQKDFRKLDFLVLPISEDYGGIELAKKFYDSYGLRHLKLLHDYKNTLFKAFEIVGLPTSILINAEGKAVATFSGAVNWYDDKVREILLSNIPNNPVTPKNSYKDRSLNQPAKPTPLEEETKAEETASEKETTTQKNESNNEQKNDK